MSKKQYYRAYQSICTLRHHKIQAARDLYYMHTLLEAETSMKLGQNKLLELILVPRNRRAMLASEIVMFMQQVSGTSEADSGHADGSRCAVSISLPTTPPRYSWLAQFLSSNTASKVY